MDPIQVREILDVSEAVFHTDEATGKMTATVRIIQAGRAKGKNRRYSSESIRKAAKEGIYDGIRMFVNHSDKPPYKRGMKELVSAVESTSYDSKSDSIIGQVEFFNKEFYDYAEKARKHIGVSADHRIRVNYVQEGQERVELVQEIPLARSVDWVVYAAAGGEILKFAHEGEGADDVEWNEITAAMLKEKAPAVYAQIAQESAGPEDDPDEEPEETVRTKKSKKVVQESVTMTKDEIQKLVQEQVSSIQTAADEKMAKLTDSRKKVSDYVGKAGLPPRTRDRVIGQFSSVLEFVEADVKEAVESAKAELKEAGAGPRISGMGSSGNPAANDDEPQTIGVRESVESFFIKPKKEKAIAGSGKEN